MLASSVLPAQNLSNSRITQGFVLSADTVIIAQNTIVPESVVITSHFIGELPSFSLDNNRLKLIGSNTRDSISVTYRILPLDLGTTSSVLNPKEINKKSFLIRIENDYSKEETYDRRFIQSNKLQYTGSFSRGINFGNTQDLVLNSDFNLQMTGDLGNNLFIKAAISDDNIPIQPEGNTQVLQEFDKVFIEIQKNRTKVIAGDYELGRPNSYFMNYYKKLKGLSASNLTQTESGWSLNNKGSFAISRGKFKRLQLTTREGNQGPYKLEGESGDVFLQVLSGTEKVYADGVLLQRGDNYDYIIDYNRAEIRFTANMVITANKRIIVEYEFATQSYLRSLYATSSEFKKDRLTLGVNFYNEQDSKSLSGNVQLDSTDIRILNESGDGQALKNGIFIPTENDFTGFTKYQFLGDTLSYAPEAQEHIVAANFSNVGIGAGSYTIDNEVGANGRVYRYVGSGMGTFDPVIQLKAPEKKQLITTSATYEMSDSSSLYVEAGVSHFDKNRFSENDNGDNIGASIIARFSELRSLRRKTSNDTLRKKTWSLKTELSAELKQKNFSALNPYRPAEFTRNWNLDKNLESNDQLLHHSLFSLTNQVSTLGYGISGFHDRNNYTGLKHKLFLQHNSENWSLDGKTDLLNSTSNYAEQNTTFLRPNLLIKRRIHKGWRIGAYYEKEKNIRKDIQTDSLLDDSFDYGLYRFFVTSDITKPFHLNAAFQNRDDYRVKDDALQQISRSKEYNFGGGWQAGTKSNLRWNITLRDFQDIDLDLNDESKQTLIGTIEHDLRLFNKGLVLNSYYESNSGQEPKIEFQYVQVQKGEGSYVWEDFNQDSLMTINEFRIAPQSDLGQYEKISVFNNEFISSNKTILNQSFKLIPKKMLKNKKHFIGKFQFNSRYRVDQRSATEDGGGFVKALITDLLDTTLISYNSSMDHSLFFNRGNVSHDLQISYRTINNVLTQITGRDSRGNEELFFRGRYNVAKSFDLILETAAGMKVFDSESFTDQNFIVDYWRLIPKISYRPSPKFRIVTKYSYERNKNRIGALENSRHQDLGTDITWRKSATSSLQANFNIVLINFEGSTSTPIEFELLQGLKDGTNYLWNINYTRRVAKNFDMILTYNARKSEDAKMVNNLGAQLRAVF